jgi:CDP-6-deoxy-D-xylo-4-hexulose-3-dehydrase
MTSEQPSQADALREQILELVGQYHAEAFPERPFVGGISKVPVSGRVFDDHELRLLVESGLDFWLTSGPFAEEFESKFAKVMGVRHAMLTNSGSSSNLLALSALTSPRHKNRRLVDGDEVVTLATSFPTTVNPIIQNRLVPVFIDVQLGTYQADIEQLQEAIGPKTRAIFMAHTLGNVFDLDVVMKLAKEHGLWVIEDACDAVGATWHGKPVGSFGDLATTSFYPAHHITMGEGGAVLTKTKPMRKIVESFRDWGRDCWCAPGDSNTCGRRYGWQLGDLPYGYDHKFTYSHIGYNMKATEMQAAVGVAQLTKLDGFVAARRKNWAHLREGLADLEDFLLLPHATPGSEPSWFGFPITVRPEAPFSRLELVEHLESRRIDSRPLFAGDLTRHPAYSDIPHRVVGPMPNAELITNATFWIGVYPDLGNEQLDFVLETFHDFVSQKHLNETG